MGILAISAFAKYPHRLLSKTGSNNRDIYIGDVVKHKNDRVIVIMGYFIDILMPHSPA